VLNDAFSEYLPPLTDHEALVEANRCLYCFDAPCIQACPTHIDIPSFIKKIATENLRGSARVILESNFLGGTCARVCPVQELCEGACVLGKEHNPIEIGRLQRYSTDHLAKKGIDLFRAGVPTGKKIAVVGSGPAGISCAAELAKQGHAVTLLERRELGGGLSTYGIIVLREPVEVALAEVEALKRLGVQVQTGVELGKDVSLEALERDYDAVFLAIGLGAVPQMGIPGEEFLLDGIDYIEQSKMQPHTLERGQNVLVVGAGNTAIDAATIAKRLGSTHVTMIYRRTPLEMTAYEHEFQFAKNEGIEYRFLTQPIAVVSENGKVTGLECLKMELGTPDSSGRAAPVALAGSNFVIPADLIIKAIGQEKPGQEKPGQEKPNLAQQYALELDKGYIKVNEGMQTSREKVFALAVRLLR
jgi:dihydropyrimidine dehydrogenase (NAD+) subunit PreT